jgi:hypothetical protein
MGGLKLVTINVSKRNLSFRVTHSHSLTLSPARVDYSKWYMISRNCILNVENTYRYVEKVCQ